MPDGSRSRVPLLKCTDYIFKFPDINLLIKGIVYFSVCRDVQKQKALVKNESLLTILSGETLQCVLADYIILKELV